MLQKLKNFLLRFEIDVTQINDKDRLKDELLKIHPYSLSLITSSIELCSTRADRILTFLDGTQLEYFDYLDIGCGNGITTKYISSTLGVWGFGIDVTDSVSPLITDEEFSFEKCDGTSIPYSNESFRLITIINVLHHISHISSFLTDVNRVMKRGGVLYVEEMCINDDVTCEDINFMHKIFGCEEELYSRTFSGWDDVISFFGFERRECGKYDDEYNTNYIIYVKK